jgi:hypothetical protein
MVFAIASLLRKSTFVSLSLRRLILSYVFVAIRS